MAFLEFKNYSAYYKIKGKRFYVALNNLSLTIEKGSFCALMGENGSGKTTLLKSIMGFCDFCEGKVLIEGKEPDSKGVLANSVGYVSQSYSLYSHLTVFDNIAFPLRNEKLTFPQVEQIVCAIAEKLEISLLLTRKPIQISVGQQQRVAIARALVKNPQLLLLDEPFANLNDQLAKEIGMLLKNMQKAEGLTVVMVTQSDTQAISLCDRVIYLNDGKVEKDGEPKLVLVEGGANG